MVSPHFPPDTSAATHRVRLLAPHLATYGWEPTVITVDPAGYEGRLDPDLERLVPPSLRVLRASAWPAHLTRRFGLGDLGLRSFSGIRQLCDSLLARERFDALFITTYPTYPALLGPGLKKRHGVPFVLDYQDPWVGAWGLRVGGGQNGSPDLKSRVTRALAQRLEPRVVTRADALTAVSARTYEDVLARNPNARPRACAAIPLGFEEADLDALMRTPRPNAHFDSGDGCVHVCYVGTVLPTGTPVLRSVLTALRELKEAAPVAFDRLRIHFLGTSNQRDGDAPLRVIPLARELGVDSIVREVAPRLDYLDALNVQVQASALLLMGNTEPHYTPSKVFPALLARRPIVAIYHSASSVVDVLAARSHVSLSTFGDGTELDRVVPQLVRAFERLSRGNDVPVTGDAAGGFEDWTARTLARRLADVFAEVAS
jgi:glycosyltransferase involved in cell wall biosynthesis